MVVPISNEAGLPISPLTANTALDISYYQGVRELYFGDIQIVLDMFVRFFNGNAPTAFFLPGPLFPSLLQLFDYGPDNTLPQATAFLLLSLALVGGS